MIAVPGSGKTSRVILPKVTKVLENDAVNPKSVLILTFSRLSAKDLKDKVGALAREPRASTVHSLCLAFLVAENGHSMRNRVESIVLEFEKDALIADLGLIFTQKGKRQLKSMLAGFAAGWATNPHDEVFEETDEQRDFKAAVLNWLSEHESALMEEIVYGAVDLAKKLGASDFIREPRYIFVDEYQDLNRLEQEFIELLAEDSDLLMVVGDPDQSIYSFKFAYPSGIKEYAAKTGVESHSSLQTGRCPKPVVDIANQLLRQAEPGRFQLLESVSTEPGEVHFVRQDNQESEFRYVLKSIACSLQEGASGVTPPFLDS